MLVIYLYLSTVEIQEHVFAYVEMGRFLFLSKQNKSDTTNVCSTVCV